MLGFLRRMFMGFGLLSVALAGAGGLYGFTLLRKGFSARDTPSRAEALVARGARTLSIPARAKALPNPLRPTGEELTSARAHWADHCALCHANDGSGDTSLGKGLFPRAPDMREATTQNLSDGSLYYIIQNGIRLTGMPAWGEAREDDLETWGLVTFVRHLPRMTAQEVSEMKSLNPRSVHEVEEEESEDAFLDDTPPKTNTPPEASRLGTPRRTP